MIESFLLTTLALFLLGFLLGSTLLIYGVIILLRALITR